MPHVGATPVAPAYDNCILGKCGHTVTLTDRYAPVDQMLLPVFLDLRPR
jgi:hypothetical protein